MDFWIPLLGGALGAALINGVLALYKLKRDTQTEHKQWLRDTKQEAYASFFKEADTQFHKVNQWETGRSPEAVVSVDELAVNRAMIKLVGSPGVRVLAREIEADLVQTAFLRTAALTTWAESRADTSEKARQSRADAYREYHSLIQHLRDDLIHFVVAAREDLDIATPHDERLNESQSGIVDPLGLAAP